MNGDGYSPEWPIEAAKRGLPNHVSTVEALDAVDSSTEIRDLLSRYGVLSPEELESHLHVDYVKYVTTIDLESECLKNMARKYIVPATVKHQNNVLQNAAAVPDSLKSSLKKGLEAAVTASATLSEKQVEFRAMGCCKEQARFARKTILPAMAELRKALDNLENIIDHELWPFPSYEEILLARHHEQE